jgi:hypothetical protein
MEPQRDAGDNADVLRLELGFDGVPLGRLIEAQSRFLTMIREVAGSVVGGKDDVRWVVEAVEAGSLDVLVRPEPARQAVPAVLMPAVIQAVALGLAELQERAVRPSHFSDLALEEARQLARLRGRGITHIEIRAGPTRTTVTSRLAANVEEVVGHAIEANGSIEGTLEAVTVHGRRVFFVWDPLTGRRIECDFGHRIPAAEVGQAVERRVGVTGLLRYRENGTLTGIRAERLYIFPDDDDLPTADDVLGILAVG